MEILYGFCNGNSTVFFVETGVYASEAATETYVQQSEALQIEARSLRRRRRSLRQGNRSLRRRHHKSQTEES